MKVPVFQEVQIHNSTEESLLRQIKQSPIGELPTYINLVNCPPEEIQNLVVRIEDIFEKNGFLHHFPYPCYILSELPITTRFMRTADNEHQLPKFFKVHKKQLTSKEGQSLKHVEISQRQLSNLNLAQKLEKINICRNQQKQLHLSVLYEEFLSEIIKNEEALIEKEQESQEE